MSPQRSFCFPSATKILDPFRRSFRRRPSRSPRSGSGLHACTHVRAPRLGALSGRARLGLAPALSRGRPAARRWWPQPRTASRPGARCHDADPARAHRAGPRAGHADSWILWRRRGEAVRALENPAQAARDRKSCTVRATAAARVTRRGAHLRQTRLPRAEHRAPPTLRQTGRRRLSDSARMTERLGLRTSRGPDASACGAKDTSGREKRGQEARKSGRRAMPLRTSLGMSERSCTCA